MANKTITLHRRVKTPEGWKRYPAAMSPNGRVKPNTVKVGDIEVAYPIGSYELRSFEGSKTVWKRIEGGPSEALAALKLAQQRSAAAVQARDAGLQVISNPDRASIRDARDRFVDSAMARGAQEAADVYRRSMDEFLESCSKTYADEIDHGDVVNFHHAMRKRGRSDRTIFNRHMHLRAFLIFIGMSGPKLKEVAGKKPRFEKLIVDIYEKADLDLFFEKAVKTSAVEVFYDLLLETGLREREVMHLEWADLKFDRNVLKVESKPRYKHKIKDAEEREIPMSESLVGKLKSYREGHKEDHLVFGRTSTVPDGHLLRRLKTIARKAGLNCGRCEGCVKPISECEKWYLHKFRATFITTLLRGGMDLRTVMTLSGHSDLASVERYIRPADSKSVQALVNSMRFR
jgi:integrase